MAVPTSLDDGLLPCASMHMLDHLPYLLLDPGLAEGCRSLHRREVDGGLPELQYDVLDENEPPGPPGRSTPGTRVWEVTDWGERVSSIQRGESVGETKRHSLVIYGRFCKIIDTQKN